VKKPCLLILFFFFASVSPSILFNAVAYAAVFKWKDDSGKTHFTDSPDKVPLKYRKKENIDKSFNGKPSAKSSRAPQSPAEFLISCMIKTKSLKKCTEMMKQETIQLYNITVKMNLYTAYLACRTVWANQSRTTPCTMEKARREEFRSDKLVTIQLFPKRNVENNFLARGMHKKLKGSWELIMNEKRWRKCRRRGSGGFLECFQREGYIRKLD